jgi:hypothetical protein
LSGDLAGIVSDAEFAVSSLGREQRLMLGKAAGRGRRRL